MKVLLDTDVLSAILKSHTQAQQRARLYLTQFPQLTISIITRYEILRGLHAKSAVGQLRAFEQFCARCEVLPLTDAVITRAAQLYGDLHVRGQLIGDADILIAATALENGLILSSNNTAHHARINGLQLDNWLT